MKCIGSSAVWLNAPSKDLRNAPPRPARDDDDGREGDAAKGEDGGMRALVYRPMGDAEVLHLVSHNQLPGTQPYQAIIEGEAGRLYAEKYLSGRKWVDTSPTTVVEFDCPRELIDRLFAIQHKPEDGAMSMGLGHKAGGGLPLFNQSLAEGTTTWRVVRVKRQMAKKEDKSSEEGSGRGRHGGARGRGRGGRGKP